MIIANTVEQVQKSLAFLHAEKRSVGFVPTMGALHAGHTSLIRQSVSENDITVVSVFVNPTQFNDKNDFTKYPRTLKEDVWLLEPSGTSILFAPGVEDIYPEQDTRQFNFGTLDKVMEGMHRPGHFNGVAQVVSRLFEIVKPTRAYFGEKDFQQLAIIRTMVKQLQLPVQIVGMPIVREASGLALSSRNARLTADQRKLAVKISEALTKSRNFAAQNSVEATTMFVVNEINSNEGLEVEYYDIVDGNSLQSISEWQDTDYAVGCIAVFCGEVRLIDNITYFTKQ